MGQGLCFLSLLLSTGAIEVLKSKYPDFPSYDVLALTKSIF